MTATRRRRRPDLNLVRIDAPVDKINGNLPQNQLANAIAARYSNNFRWDAATQQWYQKVGVIWQVCRASIVTGFIKLALDESKDSGYTYSLISALEKFMQLELQLTAWTTDRNLLPLENGVLNLSSRKLEQYENRLFNWKLPYSYDSEATCFTVKRYLVSATNGQRSLVRLLLAWMYAVLTGRYDLQKYLETIGAGGTGKSTFQELCTLLVGEENRVVTDLKRLEKSQFESANLKHKRLTLITDSVRFGGDMAKLKAITGSDPLPYEKKGIQAAEPFVYTGMVMVAANEAIQSSDYTSGLARRKISVKFNNRISDSEKQRYRSQGGIAEVMKCQLSGLLNWLLEIDGSEAINIINNPEKEILRQSTELAIETNPILGWLDESVVRCTRGEESTVGNKSSGVFTCLFPNYVEWCGKQGKIALSMSVFSNLVVDNCASYGVKTVKRRGRNGVYLEGLRLRGNNGDHSIPMFISNDVSR